MMYFFNVFPNTGSDEFVHRFSMNHFNESCGYKYFEKFGFTQKIYSKLSDQLGTMRVNRLLQALIAGQRVSPGRG